MEELLEKLSKADPNGIGTLFRMLAERTPMAAKRGRPKLPQDQRKPRRQLNLRYHAHQLQHWKAAASSAGLSLSQWIRSTLDQASGPR